MAIQPQSPAQQPTTRPSAAPRCRTPSSPTDLPVVAFASGQDLWEWLEEHHATHSGAWVQLQKARSTQPSITFHELLEAGIAFGWSESTRRAHDASSYLQRFTPRRLPGTTSERNLAIARRLEREGRLTAPGRRALGLAS